MQRFYIMKKRILRLIKRSCYRPVAAAELILLKVLFRKQRCAHTQKVVLMQNSHRGDFVLSLELFRRLKRQLDCPLVLIGDWRIREAAAASGIFDEFVGVDMKRAGSYRHLFCRWRTFGRLRKISGSKFVQCYGAGATSFDDCAALAVNAPEKYIFVDSFYNVQRSGTFYEALRTRFFTHTLPYRRELTLLENENNFADFITGKSAFSNVDEPAKV